MNYYPERDGPIEALESGETTTSELLAQILPAATVTKAFNAIPMTQLESDGLPAGRKIVGAPLAGDSEKEKRSPPRCTRRLALTPSTPDHCPKDGVLNAASPPIAYE